MILKGIIWEDTVNYKKISTTLMFPKCSFKCDKECGIAVCQNSSLVKEQNIDVSIKDIIERYIKNPISEAIVCQGLEPFDSEKDLLDFISCLRNEYEIDDDLVIYTGYTENEKLDIEMRLQQYKNIIVKYGRYVPNQERHYDELLGIYLSSSNQYSKKIN